MRGVQIAVVARPMSLTPAQMFALVDELQSIAFCCPHLAGRIEDLARELELAPVLQYVAWMREADNNLSRGAA